MNEATIWKLVAWILGLLVIGILVFNLLSPLEAPPQVTSLILGCLVSIAVGYSVVSPKSSPVRLSNQKEKSFRHQQYTVGVVFSIVLALLFLSKDVRNAPLSWGLIPVILLSPLLIVREYVMNTRKDRQRTDRSQS